VRFIGVVEVEYTKEDKANRIDGKNDWFSFSPERWVDIQGDQGEENHASCTDIVEVSRSGPVYEESLFVDAASEDNEEDTEDVGSEPDHDDRGDGFSKEAHLSFLVGKNQFHLLLVALFWHFRITR